MAYRTWRANPGWAAIPLIWRKSRVSSRRQTVQEAPCGEHLSRNGTVRCRIRAQPPADTSLVAPDGSRQQYTPRLAKPAWRQDACSFSRRSNAGLALARSAPPAAGCRRGRGRPDRRFAAPQLGAQPRLRPGPRGPRSRCTACLRSATGAGTGPAARTGVSRPADDGVPARAGARHRQHGHTCRCAGHAVAGHGRCELRKPCPARGAAAGRQLARTVARHQCHRHRADRRRTGGGARRRALPRTQRFPDLHCRPDRRPRRPCARGARYFGGPAQLPPPHAGPGAFGGAHDRAEAVRHAPRRKPASAVARTARGHRQRDRGPAGPVRRRLAHWRRRGSAGDAGALASRRGRQHHRAGAAAGHGDALRLVAPPPGRAAGGAPAGRHRARGPGGGPPRRAGSGWKRAAACWLQAMAAAPPARMQLRRPTRLRSWTREIR